MLGIIPAAGRGSRIQPLGFSKELLPVGSRRGDLGERPCAVSEYLLERMVAAGTDKLCFVIGPGKSDILEYYADGYEGASTVYVVQPQPSGLCDAIFRAAALVGEDEQVLVGLPDTIWFPREGFCALPSDSLAFLLFPVESPQHFDAVVLDGRNCVRRIEVKQADPRSNWIWGAFGMPGRVFHELHALWRARLQADEYMGTLVNAYLEQGGQAFGVKAGETYVDVGTIGGYRQALSLLSVDSTDAGRMAEGDSSLRSHSAFHGAMP
jgi:dTDP-glucose pyrophosphorylase